LVAGQDSEPYVLGLIRATLAELEQRDLPLSGIIPKVFRIASLLKDYPMVARFKLELVDGLKKEEIRPIFRELEARLSPEAFQAADDLIMRDYFDGREARFGNTLRGDGKKYALCLSLNDMEQGKAIAESIVAETFRKEQSDDFRILYNNNQRQGVYNTRIDHETQLRDYERIFANLRTKTHSYLVEAETMMLAAAATPTTTEEKPTVSDSTTASVDKRKVFVAYGQDEQAKDAFFTFLQAADLRPMEWEQIVQFTIETKGDASPYIGAILDVGMSVAQAVVILLTGDEVSTLRPELAKSEDDKKPQVAQPRPNVLYEAGLAMGKYPSRTVIVEMGKVRQISDLSGRHAVRIDNSFGKRQALLYRLKAIGCAVDVSGEGWTKAGDLE